MPTLKCSLSELFPPTEIYLNTCPTNPNLCVCTLPDMSILCAPALNMFCLYTFLNWQLLSFCQTLQKKTRANCCELGRSWWLKCLHGHAKRGVLNATMIHCAFWQRNSYEAWHCLTASLALILFFIQRPRWQRMPSSHVFYHRSTAHKGNYVLSFAFCFDKEDEVYQFAMAQPYTYSRHKVRMAKPFFQAEFYEAAYLESSC